MRQNYLDFSSYLPELEAKRHGLVLRVHEGIVSHETANWEMAEAYFQFLRRQWQEDTKFSSKDEVMHWAHQCVVAMGQDALIFIFRDLADPLWDRHGVRWFAALYAITGENLHTNEMTTMELRDRWVMWATDRNYYT